MRKFLLVLLLIILLVVFGGMVISGIHVGNRPLGYSIQNIIKKNDELDRTIASLNTKIDTEYKSAKDNLDASFKKLQGEKQTYQQTIAYSSQEELMAANQTVEYKLDYVWMNIGLYATKHGVVLKADLSHGSSGVSNQYNISFTAIGEYLPISEFIYEIEKDPNLGFRIEEFAMVPYSEASLQATFIIKNVAIDPDSLSKSATVSTGTVTDNTASGSANRTTTSGTTNGTGTTGQTAPATGTTTQGTTTGTPTSGS